MTHVKKTSSSWATASAWAVALPTTLVAIHASADEFLTVRQAQVLMFPQATGFGEQAQKQTREWLKIAGKATSESFESARLRIWEARQGTLLLGYFVTDQVIGKSEKIDYAVAVNPDGSIRQVEVLVYRESHGEEVRERDWLQQFDGATSAMPLRLRKDIRNISGSTLSCVHMTDGIRRIATLFGKTIPPLPGR